MKLSNVVFDFKDKFNGSLNRETRKQWNKRMIKEYCEHLRNLNVSGLPQILDEIRENQKSGLYKKLIMAFEERKMDSRPLSFEELAHNKLMVLAGTNLPPKSLKTIALSKTNLNVFRSMEPIIETIYYMNTGRPYTWKDMLNLAFSGLDARLVLNLDQFDQDQDIPEPTAEFFKKLGKTQITDRKTSYLKMKISLIQMHIESEIFGMNFGDSSLDYSPTEDLFIQLLAGCNAVHHNREHIIEEDIIIAYKTFFKLIKTDVTKYKADPLIVQDMHEENPDYSDVLVCKNCGEYYKLEPGESPANFESCHCGGELKHVPDKRS